MEDGVGAVPTVRMVEPVTDPDVAEMVVLPAATPVARPAELMVATPVLAEFQATELVRFFVLPSV